MVSTAASLVHYRVLKEQGVASSPGSRSVLLV